MKFRVSVFDSTIEEIDEEKKEVKIAPPPPVAGDNPAQTTGPTTEPPLYVNPLKK